MSRPLQVVVYTLTIGSVYALVALGYSLIFSTTRIVNFAQGTLVVVGGYLAWWLFVNTFDEGVPLVVVLLLVIVLSALIGLFVDLVAVLPLGRFDPDDEHRVARHDLRRRRRPAGDRREVDQRQWAIPPCSRGVVLRLARLRARGRRDPTE